MTTAAKSIPPHGTDARYKGNRTGTRPPCRCTRCTRGHRQADVQRELRRLRGERNLVPCTEILPHIQMLRASGMSQTMIAREAGVAQAVISYITTGRNKTCQTEIARRILAVQPHRFDGNAERPAIGSIRRIRALYSLGHSRADISALSGLSVASISLLAEARWNVIDNLAATALAAAYDELKNSRGNNWKNERRATAEGWRDPLWWEDFGGIDDPDFDPAAVDRELRRTELAAVRREEITHLAAFGCTAEEIHQRLNEEIALSTVRQIVQEWRTGQKRERKQVAA
ncbi:MULTISPECIES: hypothetical protein [Streptomyces]|uniref:HTH cro/C1-type domain-containing protein n=1 Tax=Streptomyces dengpaensis TaxID=2049881 RepID=A0ABN5IAC1_9ACTN|nr:MULTISPECIES: hypothetical protein [Streptomyces]AVH59931.1 hypothetical protein C4B68_33820 [Streptomyces dengpaensis]PIB09566.1 hypothetical protein B1C81_10495 [Streptomyces sp. HG99]